MKFIINLNVFDIYREYADKLVKEGKAYEKDGAIFLNMISKVSK